MTLAKPAEFFEWRCPKCGRKLAEISSPGNDTSMVEITCPRCRERNVFDLTWFNQVQTYTRLPIRS